MENIKSQLHPGHILLGHLIDRFDSYAIPGIIDRTGLVVDWSMRENERTYEKYRTDTFRTRILTAYESLSPDDQLRVSHAIAAELATFKRVDLVRTDLKRIGWDIEEGRLIPVAAELKELFLQKGAIHDAYVEIKKIAQQTSKSICIVDPHIDNTIFEVLKTIPEVPIKIDLLTFRIYGADFSHECNLFKTQHKSYSVEIRTTNEFHDRFIVVDKNRCWHIGASIKDAGKKAFMMSLIEDERNVAALISQIDESWGSARGLPSSAAKEGN